MKSAKKAPRAMPREDVSYVDDKLYKGLLAEMQALSNRSDLADNVEDGRVTSLLYQEARLLDERKYREWLGIFSDDCIYWVPANERIVDPRADCTINFDDRRRMTDRVQLIETGVLHAQTPHSRTCRLVSNIECWKISTNRIGVRSNVSIFEYRNGRSANYLGWQGHILAKEKRGLRIKAKTINLLNADQPQGNITFIL
jgi:3-phenylpropionate/cinnamic acid dioxygenase small subunit